MFRLQKLKLRLLILLTLISVAFWVHSLFQSRLVTGHFGLIHSLAPTFFLAYITLLTSFCIALLDMNKCTLLLFLQTVLLIAFLWLTTPIIGGSQPFLTHTYFFWGNIDYLLVHGHLNEDVCWYHAWPGSWLAYCILILFTSIFSADHIIVIMPFVWQLLYLPMLYLIMTRMSKDGNKNYFWMGIWLFYLGNWVGQGYLGAQSLGFLFYLIFIYSLICKPELDSKYLILCIIIFATLTATHIVTSFIVWVIVFTICFKKRLKVLLPIFTATLILWNIYSTAVALPMWAPEFFSGILNIERLLFESLFARFQGNRSRLDVLSVRLATTSLVVCIGLVGYFLSIIFEGKSQLHIRVLKTFSSVIFFVVIVGAGIGFEVPYRAYFFILPLVAYFGSKLLKFRFTATVLIILLIAFLPLHLISHYGNQLVDHQSQEDITALKFFHEMVQKGVVAGVVPEWSGAFSSAEPFGSFRNPENYWILRYEDIIWKENIAYTYAIPLPSEWSTDMLYIPFGIRDRNIYEFMYNDTESYYKIDHVLKSSTNLILAYNNGNMKIYASKDWS